jgi:hypothetical protein
MVAVHVVVGQVSCKKARTCQEIMTYVASGLAEDLHNLVQGCARSGKSDVKVLMASSVCYSNCPRNSL